MGIDTYILYNMRVLIPMVLLTSYLKSIHFHHFSFYWRCLIYKQFLLKILWVFCKIKSHVEHLSIINRCICIYVCMYQIPFLSFFKVYISTCCWLQLKWITKIESTVMQALWIASTVLYFIHNLHIYFPIRAKLSEITSNIINII